MMFSVFTVFLTWSICPFLQVVMITGDNPLTACHVAKEIRITRKRHTLVCTPPKDQGKSYYLPVQHTTCQHPLDHVMRSLDLGEVWINILPLC